MTDIAIINKALLKLGQEEIAERNEDNERAKAANAIYEGVRDTLMATYRWNFAIKRTSLTECQSTPEFEFSKQYPLPSDFLRLLDIYEADPNEVDNYAIEGLHILTNYASPIKIKYLARITTPDLYPVYFCEALACKLAFELCERLKQDPSRKQLLMTEYQFAVSEAKKTNAIQMANISMPSSSLIDIRKGY